MKKLKPQPLASALAMWSAIVMLLLGILGNMGLYTGAVVAMQQWHLFFSLSLAGIIGGMIEAAVMSYLGVYLFAWIYNSVAK